MVEKIAGEKSKEVVVISTVEFIIAFFSLLGSYFISYWLVGKYDFLHIPLLVIFYFLFLIGGLHLYYKYSYGKKYNESI